MFKPTKLTALFLLFFVFSGSSVFSQNAEIDSLHNALKTYTKRDTIRVNLLNNVASKIFTSEADKAVKMLQESEEIAENLHYKKGKAFSLLFSGNIQINKANYPLALNYFKNSLSIYQGLNDKEGIANCIYNFGRTYYNTSDYSKALEYYKNALAICEETNNQKRLASCLVGCGVIYSRQGEHEKGMECYKKALQIDEKLGNQKGISNDLGNLANLQKRLGHYTLALENYNRSIEIKEKLGDQVSVAANLVNIGVMFSELDRDKEGLAYYRKAMAIYEKMKDPRGILITSTNIGNILMNHREPKAMDMFKKTLKISTQINDKTGIASAYSNMGTFESLNKNYPTALMHFEKAIQMHKDLGLKKELAYDYVKTGKTYNALEEYDKALKYASEAMKIAKELKLIEYQRDCSLLLSDIYYNTKKYKLAYENRLNHKKLNDSVFRNEAIDKLSQIKYKFVYKNKLYSAKKRENTLKKEVKTIDTKLEASQQQKKWWIIGFTCLLILLSFVTALLKIRRIKMENQQLLLEQRLLRSQMNPHFIFNSIDNIQSLIYNKQDKDAVDYLTKFSKLTRQILETSNENYIPLSEEIEIIENYIALQQLLYNYKFDFTITIEESIDTNTMFLPPMLTQPFIENAIKHGLSNKTENGKIDINFYLKDAKLFFEVSDNGKGFVGNRKSHNHKSLAIAITKERLINYTKNKDFVLQAENIIDQVKKVVGARIIFEIPYIYEN